MADYKFILLSVEHRVATITLNRPELRNALNWPLLLELRDAIKAAEIDADVGVIVIKGAGSCFSAGHDLSETMGKAPKHVGAQTWDQQAKEYDGEGIGVGVWDGRAQVQGHIEVDLEIWNCWKPVICQLHGVCLGGAIGIALNCDLLIAAKNARIGYPPVRGMAPGEEMAVFSWHVGIKKAKELSFTGDSLTAKEMLAYNIANHVFPNDTLEAETQAIARRIAQIDPELLSLSKTMVNRVFDQQGYSHSLKCSAEYVNIAFRLKTLGDFNKHVHKHGIKSAVAHRDAPFGGTLGRYPAAPDEV